MFESKNNQVILVTGAAKRIGSEIINLFHAKNFNVIATVHIEAGWDRSNRVGETTCLTKMNALFDMPNAIAGHVWLAEKNCEEALIKYN